MGALVEFDLTINDQATRSLSRNPERASSNLAARKCAYLHTSERAYLVSFVSSTTLPTHSTHTFSIRRFTVIWIRVASIKPNWRLQWPDNQQNNHDHGVEDQPCAYAAGHREVGERCARNSVPFSDCLRVKISIGSRLCLVQSIWSQSRTDLKNPSANRHAPRSSSEQIQPEQPARAGELRWVPGSWRRLQSGGESSCAKVLPVHSEPIQQGHLR